MNSLDEQEMRVPRINYLSQTFSQTLLSPQTRTVPRFSAKAEGAKSLRKRMLAFAESLPFSADEGSAFLALSFTLSTGTARRVLFFLYSTYMRIKKKEALREAFPNYAEAENSYICLHSLCGELKKSNKIMEIDPLRIRFCGERKKIKEIHKMLREAENKQRT